MKLFLAGLHSEENRANINNDFKDKINVLESFYYVKDWMIPYIENHWHFILDSGAFTFLGKKGTINWKLYVKDYANFILKHNIELFFELDIDNLIGIQETRELRQYLEDLTGKKSIPVWRPKRGVDYWYEMLEYYDYVAISASGKYDSKWTRSKNGTEALNTMVKQAHKNNTKVHGLGYTSLSNLYKIQWDSVDSTAWLYGNRSGFIYQFDGKNLRKIKSNSNQTILGKNVAVHNLKEWIKFQKYAETNL